MNDNPELVVFINTKWWLMPVLRFVVVCSLPFGGPSARAIDFLMRHGCTFAPTKEQPPQVSSVIIVGGSCLLVMAFLMGWPAA